MNWMFSFLMFWLVFALSFLLTAVLRRYAIAKSLMDLPSGRSSHSVPTPRGGGLAIVLSFLAALVLNALVGGGDVSLALAVGGAGAWVAMVGFLDDHGHIPARWRLLAHFVAASWVLEWMGGLSLLAVLGFGLDLRWLGYALALVYMVWLLNLYNFMDGIDGIASIEAVSACLGGALVYVVVVPGGTGWVMPVLLLAAVAGFISWNFPYAKIFMGDAGSGFLGLMMGVFSIHAASVAPELFWCWVILLGVFVVDATVTLVRRVLRGEKFYEAHRSHAYQYASRKYGAHWRVSIAVGGINLFWLLPLALLVAIGRLDGAVGVLVGYVPLICLAFYYKAGVGGMEDF